MVRKAHEKHFKSRLPTKTEITFPHVLFNIQYPNRFVKTTNGKKGQILGKQFQLRDESLLLFGDWPMEIHIDVCQKCFLLVSQQQMKSHLYLCRSIIEMINDFIKFPEMRVETKNATEKFKLSKNCKIRMVVGALDGTHITTVAPDNENKVDYYNGKQRYSINTQVVVGGDLIFPSVTTGYSGSLHDSGVLRNSNLF